LGPGASIQTKLPDYSVLLGFGQVSAFSPRFTWQGFQLSAFSLRCMQEPKKLAEGLIRLN
jgi:hypothetical protein